MALCCRAKRRARPLLLPQCKVQDFHATHVRAWVPRGGGASRTEQSQAIGRAGREIHDAFLCPMCLANWLKTTLEAYHEHLGLGLVLSAPAEASKFFRAHLPCDRMIEVMREGHPRARPMDANDPFHPCRRGGPMVNESWWSADHASALELSLIHI